VAGTNLVTGKSGQTGEWRGTATMDHGRRAHPIPVRYPEREDDMDPTARKEIEVAVQAIDEALTGLIGFAMTLRPTLRNEILQICGRHLERARQAKERLDQLLQPQPPPHMD
jgi:hypothetical protein